MLVLYEATADLGTAPADVRTPLAPYRGVRLSETVGLVPVLRAGIGMVEAALQLIPEAQVWHIGLFRDERTLRPIEYYNKLPSAATAQVCLVLDPMLATGGSLIAAIDFLLSRGAVDVTAVCLIAAPEGLAAVEAAMEGREVTIVLGAVDEKLNEVGYIVPGLGDAGDRLYGLV